MRKKNHTKRNLHWREIIVAIIVIISAAFLLAHPEIVTFIVSIVTDAFILTVLGVVLIGGLALMAWVLRQRAEARRIRAFKIVDIDGMSGSDFEQYVAALLRARGFRVKVTGKSGDLGVDVIAQNAHVKYAVQVKRYSEPVSRRAVSDAVAGMSPYGCNAAMVITNGYFTPGAIELANSTQCELIDRNKLAEWILDFQNS